VLVIGIVLALLGWLLGISILQTLGIILVVVGAVLLLLGASGVYTGRRWY